MEHFHDIACDGHLGGVSFDLDESIQAILDENAQMPTRTFMDGTIGKILFASG